MKRISFLLGGTILSTLSSPVWAAALKEPEVYFHPAKSWVVGKASEEASECAIQSEFNNGFVLQFDGAGQNIQSFTINFRQNIFNEGQTYDVNLGVPGKARRTLPATATGPTMLTMPMQNSRDLYEAAREVGALDVTIDDNAFRFYLVNFAPAAASFEQCMGESEPQMPIAPQAASAPAAAMKAPPPPPAETLPEIQIEDIPPAPAAAEMPEPEAQPAPQPIEPLRNAQAPAPPEEPMEEAQPLRAANELAPPARAQQRERTQMTASSQIAPPPPNAFNIDETAMVNESIALEEQEKSHTVPITEILPDNVTPQAEDIVVAEENAVAEEILEHDSAPAPTSVPVRDEALESQTIPASPLRAEPLALPPAALSSAQAAAPNPEALAPITPPAAPFANSSADQSADAMNQAVLEGRSIVPTGRFAVPVKADAQMAANAALSSVPEPAMPEPVMPAPVEPAPVAALPVAEETVNETPAPSGTRAAPPVPADPVEGQGYTPPYRKRMSELLDAEIRRDPRIASADDDAPRNLPENLAVPAQAAATTDVAQENLAPPPVMMEEPRVAAAVTPEPAAMIAAETAVDSGTDLMAVLPTVEENPTFNANEKVIVAPVSAPVPGPIPVQTAAQAAIEPSMAPAHIRAQMEAQARGQAFATQQTVPGTEPASPEPFSQPGEVIETEIQAGAKPTLPKPIVRNLQGPKEEIVASLPPGPPYGDMLEDHHTQDEALAPAPMPQAPVRQVQNIKSPEIVVHKSSQKVEADITGLDDIQPANNMPSSDLPYATNDPTRVGDMKADPEMLQKISQLEKEVNKLRDQNENLNSELQNTSQSAQAETASIASENWNLERATMRYNEAERQIKRLSEQLARERAKSESEKKDLQAQLFDPRITEQQQLAKLAELERQLEETQRQLEMERVRRQSASAPPATGMQ